MNYLLFTFKGLDHTTNIAFCCWFSCKFSVFLEKLSECHFQAECCRKVRITAISSSQWNVLVVSIF